ncbi:MAG: hypothetical protein M1835_001058 [Candelina submexicana]|nr:MAG: hypothetical protein M1835_001058 [Candelina submexicana]
MSTAVSTPPPSLPVSHHQPNNIAIPADPSITSSANPLYTPSVNRDTNNKHFQQNRKGPKSRTLETASGSTPMMNGTKQQPIQGAPTSNPCREDGSVSEPVGKVGHPDLPRNKKKGRQPGRKAKNRTVSQPGEFGSPAPARPTSTGNASNITPGRPLGTPPKQAYAGPTFHASPAPSALPIPRFFSKSVPGSVSGNGLQSKSEDSSSEASDSSPTPVTIQLAGQQQATEESPLDIFFKADREEKAKARGFTPSATPLQGKSATSSRLSPSPPTNLPSPLDHSNRQHSRHPTGGSASDMFALEMDGADVSTVPTVAVARHAQGDRMSAHRSNTAPSSIVTQKGEAEEQRRAKTQALKSLLLSPQPQRPASSSPRYGGSAYESDGNPESSSPSPCSRGNISSRHVSPTPTIALAADPSKNSSRRSHHASFPFLHESLLATANGSPKPVPRSSNLRQELSPTTTPHHNLLPTELPASPSSKPNAKYDNLDVSLISRNNLHSHISGKAYGASLPGPVSAHSPGFSNGSGGSTTPNAQHNATDTRIIEDDLRRMLKMDNLNGAGVSGLGNGTSTSAASSENRLPFNKARNGVSGL